MGLFTRKKKSASVSSSPASTTSTALPSPYLAPVELAPTLRLRVALDPVPLDPSDDELFYIAVNPDEQVSEIRKAISRRLGDVSMSLFKVSIPWQAQVQARTYTARYGLPVNLITSFPSFCLDDPSQLAPSLGPAGWQAAESSTNTVADWFPLGNGIQADMISVLVRPARDLPSTVTPLTLLVHFAPVDGPRSARPKSSSAAPSERKNRRPPAVVDIDPSVSVDALKSKALQADGRVMGSLERIKLWRVEMSEEEMVVIEERGGLRGGQMPWPYPPTATVPTQLAEGSLPVSHYFSDAASNGRMVSLSLWIHASAAPSLAPVLSSQALDAPLFRYPMTFSPDPSAPLQSKLSPQSLPPISPPTTPESDGESAMTRSRRARPSTAPAVVTPGTSAPAFGSRSTLLRAPSTASRTRIPSPLSAAPPITPRDTGNIKGLNIDHAHQPMTPPDDLSTSSRVPSLDFSNMSLNVEIVDPAPRTPDSIRLEYFAAAEHGMHIGGGRVTAQAKSRSLSAMWRRGAV